ncbi:M61 family metallopeptidase [Gloeobacter kilaueensis]|uniref:Peptidase M61 domain-containing protein n=1 Tax=Gloeobacter kilaueensis (strain ATCC BAA-2537 / CCAP 1431/1 / ULC 316 / JS1) TaxID=1183438 RepID=U5QIW1_GLOK1|nr:M61 family metallopeptidase [Gloeobacter kilaueensis]AGY58836.1 peptidase M61 domain-containing protein [Gloeobacter kilaueensis JS1]
MAPAGFAQPSSRPIILEVDATEAARQVFHAHLTIPVTPGETTLVYPKWIPGNHAATGPIRNLVNLKLKAGGQTIPWRRDLVEMHAFHLTVPAGVEQLEVNFDFLAGRNGTATTDKLAVIDWNTLVLYPDGNPSDSLTYTASLKLPSGWRYGTALPVAKEANGTIDFLPATLTTLIDSPLVSGQYYRKVELSPAGVNPTHQIDLVADSAEALAIKPRRIEQYKQLVSEAYALYGARHYRDYHFLWTLSDAIDGRGLEHHESSENGTDEQTFSDDTIFKANAGLLPHEYTHSWNGKYRRPADLATPDYLVPMKDDLLWVYEGLTQYLGWVLTGRSGLLGPDESRDGLALTAAAMDNRPGRSWRPLQDTADAAPLRDNTSRAWTTLRRSQDYYPEGLLIWLEADTLIRTKSGGKLSLNDFCRRFHGGPGGAPALKTYTFEEVVATLNAVVPYDWAQFLRTRLQSTAEGAPLGGIENGGWKLVYTPERSELFKASETEGKFTNLAYSIGLLVDNKEGTIIDVVPGKAAANAGIAPDMKLLAVNGRAWSPERLREAVAQTRTASAPLELLVTNKEYYRTYRLDYKEGEKYPHLERQKGSADLVSAILKPLVPPPK